MTAAPRGPVPGIDGRVAVVTGGGSGIGAASARALSERGANVVVVDVDRAAAEQVAASLPGPAVACEGDVSAEGDVAAYVERAVEAFGRVDLHHLNAGIVGTFAGSPTSRSRSSSRSWPSMPVASSSGCARPSGSMPPRAAGVPWS
jgi:NAD(P)-dependent dehydrogenase (short-subunit alcohol dehydrogenase family)